MPPILGAAIVLAALSAQSTPETLTGAENYTRLNATVACGGATSAAAFPELRARGFAAVVNLRESHEPGADVEASAQAARAAGLRYLHIPMSSRAPSEKAFDTFIAAVKDPANSPVYIHCATANRVGAVWVAKRMLVDGWDQARALSEAEAIGLKNPGLREFALDYVQRRQAAKP